jgi:hypothetical protein
MYKILQYTKDRAHQYGVKVRPSQKKNKKIDVIYNGDVIASVGDIRFLDYPNHIKLYGLDHANNRRRLYWIRHAKDIKKIGSAGFWAAVLLW